MEKNLLSPASLSDPATQRPVTRAAPTYPGSNWSEPSNFPL
jgi:hypothetical protein